ncbi:MAG: methionyl-tRNA formyltransferase [bacterium]
MKTNKQPKIVFWGTPEFAVLVLKEMDQCGILPIAVVTAPDKAKGRKMLVTPTPVKVWAEERGIPVYQPEKLKEFTIKEEHDLFIVAAYGKIIPKNVLDSAKLGTLNVHPSLLPKWRGPSPIQSAILAGDKETGVSVILLDEEMDHGPVLKTKSVNLENLNFDYIKLEEKLAGKGGKLLCELIQPWANGEIKPTPQDHTVATFCKKIEKSDGLIESEIILSEGIDLEKSQEAERKVRALNPDPGTFTIFKTKDKNIRVKIIKAKIIENRFVPEKVIPEGKKEMLWTDFLRGHEIK